MERPVARWADATDFAPLRSALHEAFPLQRLTLRTHQSPATDGEISLGFGDGEAIESVLIPEGSAGRCASPPRRVRIGVCSAPPADGIPAQSVGWRNRGAGARADLADPA